VLVSAPLIAVTTAISTGGLHVTPRLALGLGAALLLIDGLGWRIVSPCSTASGSSPESDRLWPRRRGSGATELAGAPTEPPDGDLPLDVRLAVRLMTRRSGSAGQEVHAEPGPADQHPDTA
jgi:hypothetical protein